MSLLIATRGEDDIIAVREPAAAAGNISYFNRISFLAAWSTRPCVPSVAARCKQLIDAPRESVCKTRLIVHDSIIIRCIRCLVYLREQQRLPRNGLPSDVTSASSLSVFKNRLKTYLFRRCYETV